MYKRYEISSRYSGNTTSCCKCGETIKDGVEVISAEHFDEATREYMKEYFCGKCNGEAAGEMIARDLSVIHFHQKNIERVKALKGLAMS